MIQRKLCTDAVEYIFVPEWFQNAIITSIVFVCRGK